MKEGGMVRGENEVTEKQRREGEREGREEEGGGLYKGESH